MIIQNILQLADSLQIKYEFSGDQNDHVSGFSSLDNYTEGSFAWINNQQYANNSIHLNKVQLAIVSDDVDVSVKNVIKTDESKRLFFSAIEEFYSPTRKRN